MDHSTIHRWVIQYAPLLEKKFRQTKQKPCGRWRLDETYIRVKGEWRYYYRAVDRNGDTIDFLLTARRDKKAALRYLKKAIGSSGKPSLININKSGANTATIKQYNIDEQDHRRIKRIVKPMLGFKNFYCAQRTLAGIELIRTLKKGQMRN